MRIFHNGFSKFVHNKGIQSHEDDHMWGPFKKGAHRAFCEREREREGKMGVID